MAERRPTRAPRTLQWEYQFERLLDPKLIQAYEALVPAQRWLTHNCQEMMDGQAGGSMYARVSSDLQKENHTIQSQTAGAVYPNPAVSPRLAPGATIFRPL